MKHTDSAHKLVKSFLAAGADDVVINVEEEETSQLKFSNSKISITQAWDSFAMDVFVAVGKKLVTTTLHDFSDARLADAVQRLMKFAESAKPNSEYGGIAHGPFTYARVDDTYDAAIADGTVDGVDIVEKAVSTAAGNGAKRTAGVFETSRVSTYVLTSGNVEAEGRSTRAYLSLRAFSAPEASGHCVANAPLLRDCNIERAAASAARIAVQAVQPQRGVQGHFDILFEPLAASNLVERIGDAASAFAVESGLSCYAGKLNKPIASHAFNLMDDPTRPGTLGAASFDAEGVPTQRNTLFENGVLKTYLHNTSTAKRYDTVTTANAGLVSPEPFNLVVENGNVNKAALFEQIQRGLWVTNVWYTRFQNYESGQFSTIPRDGIFLIENGEIKHPVKDIRISENILNILRNVKAVGDDAQQVKGWEVETPVITPSILVGDVRVTKSVE